MYFLKFKALLAPDRVNDIVAAGMFTMPAWLPSLQLLSSGAAILTPILGVVWLVVQIVAKIIDTKTKLADRSVDAEKD